MIIDFTIQFANATDEESTKHLLMETVLPYQDVWITYVKDQ